MSESPKNSGDNKMTETRASVEMNLAYPNGERAPIIDGFFGFGEECPNRVPRSYLGTLAVGQEKYGFFVLRLGETILAKDPSENLLRLNARDLGLATRIKKGDVINLMAPHNSKQLDIKVE